MKMSSSMKVKSNINSFFARLPIALSLLGHGLVRLPKLQDFSHWMVGLMEKSYIPRPIIVAFSYAVPFVEVLAGLFLLIGLFTRQVIYVALSLMAVFIFGNTTIENWEVITSQLIHAGYLVALLYITEHNTLNTNKNLEQ